MREPAASFFTSPGNLVLLAILVAIPVAAARWRRRGAPPVSHRSIAIALAGAAILWVASLAAYAAAAEQRGAWEKTYVLSYELALAAVVTAGILAGTPAMRTGRTGDLAAILILFALLGGIGLSANPPRLHAEEVAIALWTRHCDEGRVPDLFGTGYFDNPVLHFFVDAALSHVLPGGLFGLRFESVLVGILGVLVTYRLCEEIRPGAGRLVPALGAIFVATHHAFLYYSRNAIHIIDPVLTASLAAYLALRALGSGGWPSALLCGAAAGVGVQGYFPNKICAAIAFGAFVLALPWPELGSRRRVLASLAAFVLGFSIALGPLPVYYHTHPERFSAGERRAMAADPLGILRLDPAAWTRAWSNVGRTLSIHGLGDDDDPHYGLPAAFLHPLALPLLLLGLARAIATPRRSISRLLIFWVGSTLVLGSLLLAEPRIRRTLAVIPAYGVLVASGADLVARRSRKLGAAAVTACIAGAAVHQVDGVLRRFPSWKTVDLPSAEARYLASHPGSDVMLMTLPDIPRSNRFIELLAPLAGARDVESGAGIGRGAALVSAQHGPLLQEIARLPGARVSYPFGAWPPQAPADRLLSDSETRFIPPALVELASDRPLPIAGRLTLLAGGDRILSDRAVPLLFFDFRREAAPELRRIALRTRITLERASTVRISALSRKSDALLTIDGLPPAGGDQALQAGPHLIEARWNVPFSLDSYLLVIEGADATREDPGPLPSP